MAATTTLTLVDIHVEIVAGAFQTRLKTFAEPPGDGAGTVGRANGRLMLRVRQIVHDRQHGHRLLLTVRESVYVNAIVMSTFRILSG